MQTAKASRKQSSLSGKESAQGPTDFARLLEGRGVDHCVYGHLHGRSCLGGFEGDYEGTKYTLVSADHLRFVPRLIAEI